MSDQPLSSTAFVVDALDETTGLAEIEFEDGMTTELPLSWLPGVTEGAAYTATPSGNGVRFTPLTGGAQALRERSKQTLLDFSDQEDDE